jgi:antitoxin VapB
MLSTRVFQNGNSQAIRIPQELRTTKKEYYINKIGEAYVIYPKDDPWMASKNLVGTFPDDFMEDRNQPQHADAREEL